MNDGIKQFEKRLKGIEKRYKKRGRHKVGSNPKARHHSGRTAYRGVADMQPTRGLGISFTKLFRRLIVLGAVIYIGMLALRVFMSLQMGETAYNERIEELSAGTQSEQYAAMAMQRGPVMLVVEEFARKMFNAKSPEQAEPATSVSETQEPEQSSQQ